MEIIFEIKIKKLLKALFLLIAAFLVDARHVSAPTKSAPSKQVQSQVIVIYYNPCVEEKIHNKKLSFLPKQSQLKEKKHSPVEEKPDSHIYIKGNNNTAKINNIYHLNVVSKSLDNFFRYQDLLKGDISETFKAESEDQVNFDSQLVVPSRIEGTPMDASCQ